MMNTPRFRLGFERKIGYSFLGLAAGNLASLAAVSIYEALGVNSLVPAGPFRERLLRALALELYVGCVSLVLWAIIGLPVVLALSANLISRLHWSLAAVIGAVLGAGALALLFVSLDGWQQTVTELRSPDVLRMDITFLAAVVLIAAVAFSFYCALVRRAVQREQRKSGAPSSAPQFFSVL